MARQTATLAVGVKLTIVQVEVPAWLRTALVAQGWTPPQDSDDTRDGMYPTALELLDGPRPAKLGLRT